jgi:hypothetical protein
MSSPKSLNLEKFEENCARGYRQSGEHLTPN